MHVFRFCCALLILAAVYCGSDESPSVDRDVQAAACVENCEETLSEYAELELEVSELAAGDMQSAVLPLLKCEFGWSSGQQPKSAAKFAMGSRPPPRSISDSNWLVI